jgi:hypothetical protein
MVEKTDNVEYHVLEEDTRETAKREAVSASTEAFLDCAKRSFNLVDVAVVWTGKMAAASLASSISAWISWMRKSRVV